MTIKVSCPNCGKTLNAPDTAMGKKVKCPACSSIFLGSPPSKTEETFQVVEEEKPSILVPITAQPKLSGLRSMDCKGCGGKVEYQDGQGLFKCKYCGSVYESESTTAGNVAIKAIHIVQKKLEKIEEHTKSTADMMQEERLQKKAALKQDEIDYKYVEFENSLARKIGTIAPILWLVGLVVLFISFGGRFNIVAFIMGGGIIAAGVGAFMYFKKAKDAFTQGLEDLKKRELEPIYEKLKQVGSVLEDGTVSLGFTESTSVPMRYCVCCHKNVTPSKKEGASFAGLSGTNLILAVLTCGMWIPAWFFIEVMARGGRLAKKTMQKGTCPECGNTTLFPARIPRVT